MKIVLTLLIAFFALFLNVRGVEAETTTEGVIETYLGITFGDTCSTEEIAGIFCIIGKTVNLLLGVAGAVAVVFMAYGGITYMISGGDEKQLGNAKAAITYAILGLFIILGAILLINTILSGLLG